MLAPRSHQQARAELEAVLHSELFTHAPSLAQFLSYVCLKCFEGQADEIKEYNIAVEALGRRPPDFDQKKDSIVRVEAHRLRKRLREYYATEGASHPLQIVMPPGHYVPEFVYRDKLPAASLELVETQEEETEPDQAGLGETVPSPLEIAAVRRHVTPKKLLLWFGGTAALLTLALIAWRLAPQGRVAARVSGAEGPDLPLLAGGAGQEIRILAGSSIASYVDRLGSTWTGDHFFDGGLAFSATPGHHISGTQDPTIFHSRREGVFSYDIPLKPGTYELHLYFAETLFGEGNIAGGGDTSRIFDVLANGKPLVSGLDVVADAPGPNIADIKVYKDISPAEDGFLHLKFGMFTATAKEKPFLNAIEILPGIPGKLRPVRIVARDTAVNAKDGRQWGTDRYFIGGQSVLRADPVKGTADPEIYMGERFGNFTYSIPVVPGGRYTTTLRFSESWFGPKKPAGGGAGSRIFDVYANGVALLRDFDIFKEAGGEERSLDKVFHSLQPNAQGKLVFSFVPIRNYACINAIEVVDEGVAADRPGVPAS